MALQLNGRVEVGDFGTWDLVPFRRNQDLITTKGADDLVGCAIMLAALAEVKKRAFDAGLLCIFSRAEEVGFLGTLGVIAANAVPLSSPVISIETSKAMSGIRLGNGPVLRLGDRTSVFHHQTILFMDTVARELHSENGEFVYQRRVMDGGTCEATPFQLNGYAAGGIAIPLRNYHNQGNTKIMPEGIHLNDAVGGMTFLMEMLARTKEWQTPIDRIRRRWEKRRCQYDERLKMSD